MGIGSKARVTADGVTNGSKQEEAEDSGYSGFVRFFHGVTR
jgi:hypothetical protein